MTSSRARKPRDADEITFIQTRSGTVHVLTCNDSDDSEPDEDLSFAEGLLKLTFSRPAMVCGRRMRIDWVGFAANPTAEPAGAFDDEQLCASCIRSMGDQSSLVFERRNQDDRQAACVERGEVIAEIRAALDRSDLPAVREFAAGLDPRQEPK